VCDQALGGVVVWTETDGTHGLIAANADEVDSKWSNIYLLSLGTSGAAGNGIRAGKENSALSIARESSSILGALSNFAAFLCMKHAVKADGTTACTTPGASGDKCYADWYLPSQYELNQLYALKVLATCPALSYVSGNYWSSTENPANSLTQAYSQSLATGTQQAENKTVTGHVRCIRAF
jgi:hypothetical protein